MNSYFGFAAKLTGFDNINGWMNEFAYLESYPLVQDVMRGTNVVLRSVKRAELIVIWVEGHPAPLNSAMPFLLIAHCHFDSRKSVPGGTNAYEMQSIDKHGGVFKELSASTAKAVHTAFDELRGYRQWSWQ